VEDRASASSDEDEDVEDANDGVSPRDSDRFFLFFPSSSPPRFGDGRDSYMASGWMDSFIFVFSVSCAGAAGWQWNTTRDRWPEGEDETDRWGPHVGGGRKAAAGREAPPRWPTVWRKNSKKLGGLSA